jgi:hypothetical protein
MISKLMGQIIDAYRPGVPLSAIITDSITNEFRSSSEVQLVIESMVTGSLTVSKTSRIYEGEIHHNLYNEAGWSAGLIRPQMSNGMVYTSPGPTAIMLVSGSDQELITRYSGAGFRLALLSDVLQLRLGDKESICARPWRVPDIDYDSWVYHLNVTNGDAVWLRINGPAECQYTHGFDALTGAYCYSTFSEFEGTQNDFLSKMFKSLAINSDFDLFRYPNTASALEKACELVLAEPSTAPPSRWRVIQALARLAPDRAKSILASLSSQSGELQAPAKRALEAKN